MSILSKKKKNFNILFKFDSFHIQTDIVSQFSNTTKYKVKTPIYNVPHVY